jgi:hypothetical protein
MEFHVDRDSVAAGDDVESHARRFTFPDGLAIEEVVERIVASGYLPMIAGGAATWSVSSGVPIAVVAQQWPHAKHVSWQRVDASKLRRRDGVIGLRFDYHAQREPEVVLEILRRLHLDPFSR